MGFIWVKDNEGKYHYVHTSAFNPINPQPQELIIKEVKKKKKS